MYHLLTMASPHLAGFTALALAVAPPAAPTPLDSGPRGLVEPTTAAPPPLLYSGARYYLFFGSERVAPAFQRQHFTRQSSSPYVPVEGPRSGVNRYRGSGRR